MDARIRDARRDVAAAEPGGEARLLAARLRAGTLELPRLKLAALCGPGPAREALGSCGCNDGGLFCVGAGGGLAASCPGTPLVDLVKCAWETAPIAGTIALLTLGQATLPIHEGSFHAEMCGGANILRDAPEGWGPTGTCLYCGGGLDVRPRRLLEDAARAVASLTDGRRRAKGPHRYAASGPSWATIPWTCARELTLQADPLTARVTSRGGTRTLTLLAALPPREQSAVFAQTVAHAARAVAGGWPRRGQPGEAAGFLRDAVAPAVARWALAE